ncbi:hypothetical protein Ancab_004016 [Ancistrocladus abbreviatus]
MIYFVILLAVFGFPFASVVLQSSISSLVFGQESEGVGGGRVWFSEGLKFAGFFDEEGRLDRLRKKARVAVWRPRLALSSET